MYDKSSPGFTRQLSGSWSGASSAISVTLGDNVALAHRSTRCSESLPGYSEEQVQGSLADEALYIIEDV